MSIYDTLNNRQQEAVFYTEGPLLILAGAGSGKTRVLTHRIAWLIDQIGVNPWNILAITFTNKAAGEMRERVDQIVGFGSESIWVSTFHSMCVRILRRYIDRLGYDTNFTIYDADDQKTLIKDVCKYLQIDTKMFKERSLLSAISSAKDELVTPEEMTLRAEGDWAKKKIAQVYTEYEKQLKANNALDFDDLLLKTVELFEQENLVFHVSGGTTDLLLCQGAERITPLGTSQDLYAGQAVDRLGVKLGYPFPAGVYVSEQAAQCTEKVHPKVSVKGVNCSLSGLENQYTKLLAEGKDPAYVCKYCLICVAETLTRMARTALEDHPGLPVVFAGGVMSSDVIRQWVQERLPQVYFVPGQYSSDNAIGVSILAAREAGLWLK